MSKRIVIVGTSCSGKTTLAKYLSKQLDIPHIELDALYWGPNWTPHHPDDFWSQVNEATKAQEWVIDGNYSHVREIVWGNANVLIWLDYPFSTIFYRALKRTFKRTFLQESLWNQNKDTFRRSFLSKDSILIWVIKTYFRRKREIPRLLNLPSYTHLKVIRIKSPRDLATLLVRYENL